MVTIGDVLGIVAFLVGLGGTAWAMTVSIGILFPAQTARASGAAKGAFLRGLLPFALGFLGVVLLSAGPFAKMMGWILVLSVLSLAAFGLAGLSRLAGRRLTMLQPEMGEYPAFLRGAGFLVTACLFPLLGWFLFTPALFIVALGAGLTGLLRHNPDLVEA